LLGVVAGGAALAGVGGAATAAGGGGALTGTWLGSLLRENPPPGFPPVRFVFTFGKDGALSASGPPVLVENGVTLNINAGHGSWRSAGTGSFLLDFTSAAYDEAGVFRNAVVTLITLTLGADGVSWSGLYRREDQTADGTVIRTVGGTVSAVSVPGTA